MSAFCRSTLHNTNWKAAYKMDGYRSFKSWRVYNQNRRVHFNFFFNFYYYFRWAFGVFMFEIFSGGETPYADIKAKDMLQHLMNDNRLKLPQVCPTEWYIFIIRTLALKYFICRREQALKKLL